MSTKAELEARVAELEEQLAAQGAGAPVRPAPRPPSFEVCAGVAADLEMTDKTVDPFTGKVVTGVDVDTDGRMVFVQPAEQDDDDQVSDEN